MSKYRMTVLLSLLLFSFGLTPASAASPSLFAHRPIPGGIAVLDLGPSGSALPRAEFLGSSVAVIPDKGRAWAIVGIGLSTAPGKHTLRIVENDSEPREIIFLVESHNYPDERISLADDKLVNPSPKNMLRIRAESRRKRRHGELQVDHLLAESFVWPVGGRITSGFGLQRYFNNQPRRPHGGIDIATTKSTPIAVPANGVVLRTGNLFFDGNFVLIEHGLGLRSFYAHLDEITVSKGDVVSVGQQLGTVGATGRVTGPHLHWAIGLNGEWLDPMLLFNEQ
jgi:murein DD-endopeptidase MepM/ murein hydrolase activator NlpD